MKVDHDDRPEHILLHKYQHEHEPKFTEHAKVQVADRFSAISMNIQLLYDQSELVHKLLTCLLSVTNEFLVLFLRINKVNNKRKENNSNKE